MCVAAALRQLLASLQPPVSCLKFRCQQTGKLLVGIFCLQFFFLPKQLKINVEYLNIGNCSSAHGTLVKLSSTSHRLLGDVDSGGFGGPLTWPEVCSC